MASGVLYHKDLHVFDAATGKLLGRPLGDVDGLAHPLLFSPDGKRLVANHWGVVYVVDAATQRLAWKAAVKAASVFFRGGKLFAVEAESSAIREVGEKGVAKGAAGELNEFDPVAGMRMAIGGDPPVAAVAQKGKLSVRDMQGRELFQVVGEDSPVRRLCLSADGRGAAGLPRLTARGGVQARMTPHRFCQARGPLIAHDGTSEDAGIRLRWSRRAIRGSFASYTAAWIDPEDAHGTAKIPPPGWPTCRRSASAAGSPPCGAGAGIPPRRGPVGAVLAASVLAGGLAWTERGVPLPCRSASTTAAAAAAPPRRSSGGWG